MILHRQSSLEFSLDIPDSRATVSIGSCQVAATDRIEDQNRTLQAAQFVLTQIICGYVASTKTNEERLTIADSPAMIQDVLDIAIRQIALRESLGCVGGD